FFFFQAEDGIRDRNVTGVQTCALPILNRGEVGEQPAQPPFVDVEHPAALRFLGDDVLRLPLGPDEQNRPALRGELADEVFRVARSEERRVGKEWRTRGAPEREKKRADE